MKCIGFSIWFALRLWLLIIPYASIALLPAGACRGEDGPIPEGDSTRETRAQATRGIPLDRINPSLSGEVQEVLENPSYFRRMPPQQINCDPRMFTFLVRRPEVMVNIWEVMGITKVKARRTSPFSFMADDGVGTACKCDLIYSDDQLHIYFGSGMYDGSLAPRKVTGRCVCLLRANDHVLTEEGSNLSGTMDVFLKVDNFGADLLTRTIGPFVGKTADYNFVETAKFISQISHICRTNPPAAQELIQRLDRVDDSTRREFAEIVSSVAFNAAERDTRLSSTAAAGPQRSASANHARDSLVLAPVNSQREAAGNLAAKLTDSQAHLFSDGAPGELLLRTDNGDSRRSPPVLESTLPTPAAIAPQKHNIYMRR